MPEIDENTVMDWYNFFRDACSAALLRNPVKLGSKTEVDTSIVEIDESLFGKKRKYHSLLVFHITCNDISVIYVTPEMCRWMKKLYLRSGSQRHRHFAGFFNVPVLHRHGTTLLYGDNDTPPHLVAFYDTLGIRRPYSRLEPPTSSRGGGGGGARRFAGGNGHNMHFKGKFWIDVRNKCMQTTVNVVIFAGGNFRENVGKTFHVGVIFTILLLFPSQRRIGLIFAWG